MTLRRFSLFVLLFFAAAGFGNDAPDWERRTGLFSVCLFEKRDGGFAEEVLELAETALRRILIDLPCDSLKPIVWIVAPSEEAFRELTGGQIPEWGMAVADPGQGTVVLKSPRFSEPDANLETTVSHELSHIVIRIAAGGQDIDRWFDEGVALVLSGDESLRTSTLFAKSILTGGALDLDEIDEVLTFRRDKASLAYQESFLAVDYLIRNHGRGLPGRMARQLSDGLGMDHAFQTLLGQSFDEFQDEWMSEMKHRHRWMVLLDVRVALSVLMVLLFLAAFVASMVRVRKKKKQWEENSTHEAENLE